ncbi:SGNH/GDSL hydrolase family protein [Granulicoccus sp. GXG6511]|uniref:SGNH/GDSL hydrolase family protein n=1 Tax=Granulicoccus sp. GXG6511 TaxID=3381351 RepID=UPI003D7CE87E
MGRLTGRRILAVLATLPFLVGLAACSGATADADTVYVVGDSLAAVDSDVIELRFGPPSWVAHLDPEFTVLGASAAAGATTEDLSSAVQRSDAHTLLILAGVNDAGVLAFDTTAYHLEAIVERTRTPHVVLSTIPPHNDRPQVHVQFNSNLGLLARDKGWQLCDPMGQVRDGVLWAPGMSDDGRYPNEAGARAIGRALSECVRESR